MEGALRLCDNFDHVFLEHLSNSTSKLRNPHSGNSEEEKRVGEVASKWLEDNAEELHSNNLVRSFYGEALIE